MVFYHGPGPYTGPRNIQSLIDAPTDFIAQLFESFHLIDSYDLSDEALKKQTWAGIMAFVFKHARARDFMMFIKPFIEMLNALEDELGSTSYQVTLINYLLAVSETDKRENLVNALKGGLSPQTGEDVMSIGSQLIEYHSKELEKLATVRVLEAGKKLGIEEGIQRGESTILIHLLECKFGPLLPKYREQINQADTKQLLAWTAKALKTNTLSELFAHSVETTN